MFCSQDKIVFDETGNLAIFFATLAVFGFLSSACWTLCIAIRLYLNVLSDMKKGEIDKYMKPMWIFSICIPSTLCAIGIYRGFGISHKFTFGIPCFIQADGNWWAMGLFVIPMLILNISSCLIMVYTIYRVSSVLLGKEDMKDDENTKKSNKTIKKRWKKMLWFNQRSLLFVLFICVNNIAAASFFTKVYVTDADEQTANFYAYFTCLFSIQQPLSSSRDIMDSYPMSQCGSVDSAFTNWSGLWYSILIYQVKIFRFLFFF